MSSRSGWFGRHKVLSTLAALVLVAAVWGEGSATEPPVGQQDRRVAPAAPADSAEDGAAPAEDGQGERETRPSPSRRPDPAPSPEPEPEPRVRTYVVTHVVDGDTLDLGNGERVRLVGIDTPEVGDCNYDDATAFLERMVLGKRVRLGISDEDRDGYGRLLRYVDVGRTDAGLRMITSGFAVARYDSRDGYGYHPREDRYVAADRAAADRTCPKSKPIPLVQAPARSCEPGYEPCVPVFPPDVDCADVVGPVRVTGPDPHGLDWDGDGFACEP